MPPTNKTIFLDSRSGWALAVRQAWLLATISVSIGVGLWLIRTDRLPLLADPDLYALDLPVSLVSLQVARGLYEAGQNHFIDTRRGEAQGRSTIPGAFIVREASFADDLEDVMAFIYPEDHLVLFGESTPLPVATVAVRFLERGYRNVRILQGGLTAWQLAGGPVSCETDDDE